MHPAGTSSAVELLKKTEALAANWRAQVPRREQVNWQCEGDYAEWLECVRRCSVADLIEAARRLSPRADFKDEAEALQRAIFADIHAKNTAHVTSTMTQLSKTGDRLTCVGIVIAAVQAVLAILSFVILMRH